MTEAIKTTELARSDSSSYAALTAAFLSFARARQLPGGKGYAVEPGGHVAELFPVIDILYCHHILDVLEATTDAGDRAAWRDLILSFQDEDGWFRPSDAQNHGVVHATAYALGALSILDRLGAPVGDRLRRFEGFRAEVDPDPGPDTAPFGISFLDRLHIWRGSHRIGGIAAIVGAVRDLGLNTHSYLGIPDADLWLDGWWRHFEARLDAGTGNWRLAPAPARLAFSTLYRRRHDPLLAEMAGAVHLYWIAARMDRPFPAPRATVKGTARLQRAGGLFEDEPYCIDLDGVFMIGRAMRQLPAEDPLREVGDAALRRNRTAVLDWFQSRPPEEWNANPHKLPGAFAAVVEADMALDGNSPWQDIFKTAWWL